MPRPDGARLAPHARTRGRAALLFTRASGAAVCTMLALGVALMPAPAAADAISCQRTISKAVTKFVKTRVKALQKCEDAKVRGRGDLLIPPDADCHLDLKTSTLIDKATSKLRSSIAKRCGGGDRVCGTADDDLDIQLDLGFPAACPNVDNGTCTNPLGDCADVGDCLDCIAGAGVDQSLAIYYDDLVPSHPALAINKCLRAIGKETTKYLLAKEKLLGKCWDARYKGKHVATCPDLFADTTTAKDAVKAARAIAKAEAKKISRICKACGGPDGRCDDIVDPVNPGVTPLGGSSGGDDFAPAAISSLAACPAVTVPAGVGRPPLSCERPITTLADLVFCVGCVSEFDVDCLDPARVPTLAPYPAECNPAAPTTTPTPGPTATVTPSTTASATATPVSTTTTTSTPTATATATATPVPTGTPTATATPMSTATPTTTVTATLTPPPGATATVTVTPTVTPTQTPTVTLTPTPMGTFVPPLKIAAAGDSITQAFAADCSCNVGPVCLLCLLGGDQPEHSWFDGSAGAVFSVHDRYLQIDASITSDKSASADGSEMRGSSNNFATQAAAIMAQVPLPDHVEIELGGNDICNRGCTNPANCGDPLYTDAQWEDAVRAGLDILVAGLPLGSTIYIAGVPRVHDLRPAGLAKQAASSSIDCDAIWGLGGVCSIATDGSTLNGEDIATRLAAIATRQVRYNEILRDEAIAYNTNSSGQNPRGIEVVSDYVDEFTPSAGTTPFGADDIDGGDCFHPSIQGQNLVATVAWAGNPDR